MTEIARLTKHPTDRECVVLVAPSTLNGMLGKFGPARLSPEHHGYVLHHSHVDALYKFARLNDLHLTDDRVSAHRGPVVQPTECRSCHQPGQRFNPPNVCPSCGAPWSPITPPVRESNLTETVCPKCKHKQPGRFPYCSRCGSTMPTLAVGSRQTPAPLAILPAPAKREHLADPMPVSAVIDEAPTPIPGLGRVNTTTGEILDDPTPDPEPEQDPDEYDPTAPESGDPWGAWGPS